MMRESQKEKLEESIGRGEIETKNGLNQELSLTRAGDARWNSHYKTLSRLVGLFSSIFGVLEYIEDEGLNSFSQRQASGLRIYLRSFDFVFYLQLMLKILGITNILSQALQRKDQDIVNAISLVKSTTTTLKKMRNDGFDALILDITSFCENNGIKMLNVEEVYVNPRARRQYTNIFNRHFYEFFCFNIYKDRLDILQELLVYPNHMQQDKRFASLKSISDLAKVMVETKMHRLFPLIYQLVKLSLVLPIATATAERCFSGMKLVKSDLRNRISDDFLNDCVICTVEREGFSKITNENVIKRFLAMRPRRFQL
ncbi:uncharacterized protein LOC111915619 [Lactuca sativa]|uniref:uncharacterized protein LOC111915619 n=1 Tax=Lactuca sativa TaxID=4236 RepID=UPI000CD86B69|nr:uncharacterized protein LOC111915619 [Lactuca sativa]